MIRPARRDDLEHLPEIEAAAGEPFRAIGMAAIADDDPSTLSELEEFWRAGQAWVVAESESDRPAGYIIVDLIDRCAHVEQVSIHPSYSRRGWGRLLLETVEQWARRAGFDAMTLTTFADVPWNAPYYERLGWRILDDSELSPGLAKVRADEAARGLDRWPRVAMRFEFLTVPVD